jgi:hypothetical protein
MAAQLGHVLAPKPSKYIQIRGVSTVFVVKTLIFNTSFILALSNFRLCPEKPVRATSSVKYNHADAEFNFFYPPSAGLPERIDFFSCTFHFTIDSHCDSRKIRLLGSSFSSIESGNI